MKKQMLSICFLSTFILMICSFIFVILRLRLLKFGVKDSNVFQIILLHIVGVTRTVI